jgi:hypothetical protein
MLILILYFFYFFFYAKSYFYIFVTVAVFFSTAWCSPFSLIYIIVLITRNLYNDCDNGILKHIHTSCIFPHIQDHMENYPCLLSFNKPCTYVRSDTVLTYVFHRTYVRIFVSWLLHVTFASRIQFVTCTC